MLRSTAFAARAAWPATLFAFLHLTACAGDGDNLASDAGRGTDSGADSDDDDDAAGDDASGDAGAGGDNAVGTLDTTAPRVIANDPLDQAVGESTFGMVSATFSEAMAPGTLTDVSFSVKQATRNVPGAVSYFDNRVTFMATSPLTLSTAYTAVVSAVATDVAGNPLAMMHSWSFTTDAAAALGPAPVLLRAAGSFAILAKSAISNVPTSKVTGDLGLSPAAASYITGFSLTKAGAKWTAPQVVGAVFAADNDPPTPSNLTHAISDMETAYTDAAGRPNPVLNLGAGTIGGLTFMPGLYKWTSAVTIPTDITLAGSANDVWIFQVTGDLNMSAAKGMLLSGGASPKNIFWQVAGQIELGSQAHAEGVLLSKTAIKLGTGATSNGRLLAQTAITLAGNNVTAPKP